MTPRSGLPTSGSARGGGAPLSLGFRSWALAAGVATSGIGGEENVMMGRRQERPSPSRGGIVRLERTPIVTEDCKQDQPPWTHERKTWEWPCHAST